MSRVARNPINLPSGVEASFANGQVSVKGPLGTLNQAMSSKVKIERVENRLEFTALDASIQANAMSGTMRALVANMVHGVSKGFERRLNLVGVGYRAQAQGDKLNLTLGFSHPVVHAMPNGINFSPYKSRVYVADTGGHTKHPDPAFHKWPRTIRWY